MKLKEIFKKSSSLEARDEGLLAGPENDSLETPKKAVEEIDEQELQYEEAIENSEREYADEIFKIKGQIKEAVRNGKSLEEIEKLNKLIIALEKGGQIVRQNLEEQLVNIKEKKHDKSFRDMSAFEEEHKHKKF